jgi:hypothetical protein
MPNFHIRGLLTLTAIVAVVLTALCLPSVYWSVGLPIAATFLIVVGVTRAVLMPAKRSFWLAFMAGLTAYGLTLTGVWTLLYLMHYHTWQPYAYGYFYSLEGAVWYAFHGVVPLPGQVTSTGYTLMDLVSFAITLHVALALLISTIAAFVAQFVMRGDQRRLT